VRHGCYHSCEKLLMTCLLSKNLNIETDESIILPVILYGCVAWSLTLKENLS